MAIGYFIKVCAKCTSTFITDNELARYCPNCEGKPDDPNMTVLQWDGVGNDLVRDIETNNVLEVNWSKAKVADYINNTEKTIEKITNKYLKAKRKSKKLRKKLEYWTKQAELTHKGILEIKMSYVTTDPVKKIADKYLDEHRVNEHKYYYSNEDNNV